MALDEARTAAGEVAAADRTMVTATSLADSQTPRARERQRRAVVARRSSLGDGFSFNFDGFDKIGWRPMTRNKATAAAARREKNLIYYMRNFPN